MTKALRCHDPIGLDGLSLDTIEAPEPGPGEVRLKVRAAGLNFADTLVIRGRYQEKPALPFAPGLEVCGEVEALGPGVEGLAPAARVIGLTDFGGFAERAVVRAEDCVPVPDAIDDAAAAGFAVAYGTSHGALRWRADLKPGETLLVFGAAGGVGLTAVEVGKAMGATVIACARGDKAAVALEHGADHALDSDAPDLRERIEAIAGPRGVDVVYDPVGGDAFATAMKVAAWEARLLVIGFASGEVPPIKANHLLVKNVAAVGFYWGGYRRRDPQKLRAGLEEALAWAVAGKLRPHVGHVLPLARWREAFELLLARKSTGKVVLTMGG